MHRPFPVSKWEMVVLGSVFNALVRPMIQPWRDLTRGGTIRTQFVRDDPLGNETKALYQAARQPFCRPFVPFQLKDFVQHEAMLIDRPPKSIIAT